jgi:transposase
MNSKVAAELCIYDSTLDNWAKPDCIDRGGREGLASDERVRLRELERKNATAARDHRDLALAHPFRLRADASKG